MAPRGNAQRLVTADPNRAGRRPAGPPGGDGPDTSRRPELPRELAGLMRPGLHDLVDRIVIEVRRAIPLYARPVDGPYGHATRQGVERAVTLFVDLVEDPLSARDRLYETCRRLGAGEAHEGRTLDDLHAAYRVGARVGWQWIMRLGQRHRLSSMVMARLAEMLFGYADELARMSSRGYRDAQIEIRGAREGLRRRLLQLVLERPSVPASVITDLALATGWPVPDEVVAVSVDVRQRPNHAAVSSWDADMLVDLSLPQPHLLLPAPLEAQRARQLAVDLGARIVVGPPMPVDAAAHSLRWARAAARQIEAGVLPAVPVTWCADHLSTLWVLADEELTAQLAKHQLAPLAGFPDRTRLRLGDTLLSWLENGGKVQKIAEELAVHPQTVRYRLRQLEQVFGERLHDPEARFVMEAVLRAAELRRRAQDAADPAYRPGHLAAT